MVAGVRAASATDALQLSVVQGGDDTGSCTHAVPCGTLQRAIDVAGQSPTVVDIATGYYDHTDASIAAGQHISIVGAGADTFSGSRLSSFDNAPIVTNSGWLSIAGVRFDDGTAQTALAQVAGTLRMTGDFVDNPYGVDATGGTATIANTAFGGIEGSDVYNLRVAGANVIAENVSFSEPVLVTDGTLNASAISAYDLPNFLEVSGGSATFTRSYFGLDEYASQATGTGDLTIADSTFDDQSPAVTVNGSGASAELVGDTIVADSGHSALITTAGDLALAGTAVVGGDGSTTPLCSGDVVDGGWNLATDDSCDLTGTGSQQGVADHGPDRLLHPPAYEGGLPDDSPMATSPLVDVIPSDASASFDPTIALCAPGSIDQRGQSRPVDGRCDVGAVELSPTVMSSHLSPTHVVYPHPVTMTATVSQPSGQVGPARLIGTVGFTGWQGPRCEHDRLDASGVAQCTYRHLIPGTYPITATFQPGDAFHASHVARTIVVERAPTHIATTTRPIAPAAEKSFTLRGTLLNAVKAGFYAKVTVDGRYAASCHRLLLDPSSACTMAGLPTGKHTIRVSFSGDNLRAAGTSVVHIVVHRSGH